MELIIWQYGSSNPENADNFGTIAQWWRNLNGKEVTWRQRIVPPNGNVVELDWEAQRFDEMFAIANPDVRGITLYWRKPGSMEERNTTVQKLELDPVRQQLYFYPQSQPTLVMRVAVAAVQYQTIRVKNPQVIVEENNKLILRDETQLMEVIVNLTPEAIAQLKEGLMVEG